MLVEYFVKRYAEKARKKITRIDKNTLKLCQSYRWPGNIRELQNIIERSVILRSGDTVWVDEAWLSSPDAPRAKSSGLLTETVQGNEKERRNSSKPRWRKATERLPDQREPPSDSEFRDRRWT